MPFPTEPLPQVSLVIVGEGVGAGRVGPGVFAEQYEEPVPQYPHCEQQRRGSGQIPFPTEPSPQVPPVFETGAGVGRVVEAVGPAMVGTGARVGRGVEGAGAAKVGYGVVG